MLAATLLWLTSCSSNAGLEQHAGPGAAPGQRPATAEQLPVGFGSLPLPSQLPHGTSGTLTDSDRVRQGEQWNAELPPNKVSGKTYTPQYAGATGRTLADAAYAVYRFNDLDHYTGPTQVQLGWDEGSEGAQEVYVGLANFAKDRWDWFKMPASWKVALPGFASYIDDTLRTYVAVVSLDNGTFELDYVLAGTNVAPVVEVTTDLDANPLNNIAPLVVSFDATASRSYGGALTGFDFDWEGDGSWDETGDPDGLGIHQYPAGNYEATIRATDNLGQQTELVVSFAAIDPANDPPTASFSRTPQSGEGPLTVQFNAAGSSDPDGYIMLYEWDFDNNGQWDYSSDTAQAAYTIGIAGVHPIKLRVTDNFYATAIATQDVTLSKGWRTTVIDNAETRHRIAIATTGSGADERACVAYQEFNNRDLRFARALNAEASSWSGYVNPVPTSADTGYSPSMDVTASGKPMIAYGVAVAGFPINVVLATDETGADWEAPVVVDSVSNVGRELALEVINTIPCIAALDGTDNAGESTVLYFTAQDGTGAAWNAPRVAMPAAQGIAYRNVTLGQSSSGLFRRPIIACGANDYLAPSLTAIAASADISGLDWELPTFYLGWVEGGRIVTVNGRPAFCGGGAGMTEPNAYYVRAADSNGADWPVLLTAVSPGALSADMQIVAGVPLICYQHWEERKLYVVSALDADGSAWDEPYVIAAGLGEYSGLLSMTLVNGEPVIAYVHSNAGVYQVRCVSWY